MPDETDRSLVTSSLRVTVQPEVHFLGIRPIEKPARGLGTGAHRDISTGSLASYRTVRVTPPNIHSLNWECP